MNDTVYIGIDPGLTVTTVVAMRDGKLLKGYPEGIVHSKGTILQRLIAYREDVCESVYREAPCEEMVVCIEKPGYNLRGDSVNIIPLFFYLLEGIVVEPEGLPPIYIVAPTSLKKFATGKGTGKKSTIGQGTERLWGEMLPEELLTPDEADAFVLAKMAEALDNPDDEQWTKYQRDTIAKVERYL
ncbi:hypothetical protein KKE60_05195 [Patescibacteria group bacterium]|nr:hypothetical protein [Patescibacteria group bacterium]